MQLILLEVKKHESIEPGHAHRYEYVFGNKQDRVSLTRDVEVPGWVPGELYDFCVAQADGR